MHKLIRLLANEFEIMAVVNGIGSQGEKISLGLPGSANAHLEKAGIFVKNGTGLNVIIVMVHNLKCFDLRIMINKKAPRG